MSGQPQTSDVLLRPVTEKKEAMATRLSARSALELAGLPECDHNVEYFEVDEAPRDRASKTERISFVFLWGIVPPPFEDCTPLARD